MLIGYLHIGSPQHGIRRYGQLIAAEARRRPDLTVVEAEVILTEDLQRNRIILVNAARQLSTAEVIHFQYNRMIWGGRSWLQVYHLWAFIRSCSCPLVVTLHDIYLQRKHPIGKEQKRLTRRNIVEYVKSTCKPYIFILRWLLGQTQRAFVCNEEEARRLDELLDSRKIRDSGKIRVVPHFVEERAVTVNSASTRMALGLDGFKTVTLLGWIFPGKGHRLLVEAMPELPPDVRIIFAGRPSEGCEWLAEEILTLAKTKGVEDRLLITGYLSEEELERYLAATDLAICPFETCSASGSLSTWISVAHLILASDLPQIGEYNRLEPGAIKTFQPYTSEALAQAILQLLRICDRESEAPAVARLRQRLCMPGIFDEHLIYYQNAAYCTTASQAKAEVA